MSYSRFRPLVERDRASPNVPPQIVVKIVSPDDQRKDIDEKRRVYFAWGGTLEIIVNPQARTVDFYDGVEHFERVDASVGMYSPAAIPGLYLPLRAIVAEFDIPGFDAEVPE